MLISLVPLQTATARLLLEISIADTQTPLKARLPPCTQSYLCLTKLYLRREAFLTHTRLIMSELIREWS